VREPDSIILAALRRLQLIDSHTVPAMIPLTGGVSSDIWRVDLADGAVCVKRALPKLKVNAVWEAPIERNQYEWQWLKLVTAILPDSVPELVAHDVESGCFVMSFLEEDNYTLWKHQLLNGTIDETFAQLVGGRLATIHSATAQNPDLHKQFDTGHIFHAIRLEPYLLASALRHPDLATELTQLASNTANTKEALVHGDVSPKNIFAGPNGPLFLDAECAWYGDPAFDVAFCLNHLLLKCLVRRESVDRLLRSFDALANAYFKNATWEGSDRVETRAAHLLPGLLLARIDGKSPIEYITAKGDKHLVRKVARKLLQHPVSSLGEVRDSWNRTLAVD